MAQTGITNKSAFIRKNGNRRSRHKLRQRNDTGNIYGHVLAKAKQKLSNTMCEIVRAET
jgi:hypothetical protein